MVPRRLIALAALLASPCAATALAQSPAAPPAEAVGADADAARAWIAGRWSMTMTPPGGTEADAQSLTIDFKPDGHVDITFGDQGEPEGGAWRVTAADAGAASILLDEDELDADPEDDVYLDIAYRGDDAGKGVLRSLTETDRVDVVLTRSTAASAPEPSTPASETPKGAPVALLAEPPAAIAGAVDAVKAAGAPADARLEAAAIDLNGDGADEALVKVTHMYWCSGGMEACRIFILARDDKGAWQALGYPYSKGVAVLDSVTRGYRDLVFDEGVYVKSEYGGYERKAQ